MIYIIVDVRGNANSCYSRSFIPEASELIYETKSTTNESHSYS